MTPRPKDREGSDSVRTSACEIEDPVEAVNLTIARSKIIARLIDMSVALCTVKSVLLDGIERKFTS